jgi:hypothetical protein
VVAEMLTGEWDKGRPAAAGEEGGESSLAWALREMDMLPVALFETVYVLDRWTWGTFSACQVWSFDDRRVSTSMIFNSFLFPHHSNPKSNYFYLCSTAISSKEEEEADGASKNIQGGGSGVAGDGNGELP